MGGGDSKMSSSTSYPNLDLKQVDDIRAHFSKSSGKSGEINKQDFLRWKDDCNELAESFFNALSTKDVLKQDTFLDAVNKLGGDADDVAPILLKIHGSIINILSTVAKIFAKSHNSSNGDALREFLIKDAPKDDSRLSNYLISCPIAAALIRHVYSPLWKGAEFDLLPKLAGISHIIDSACSLAVLNAHLPMERRSMWTLLFSSAQHGSSFSQLQKRISGEGPCIVVIRSTDDRIFGCFAADGFLNGPQYRGDATCFLFEIAPKINVYFATGKSDHYAYLNCQQETLPNGLGIGGSSDIWPLFINEEYGTGITCKNISSFEKCWLSGSQNFEIKDIEVWRVGLKRRLTIDEEERIRSPKSIIDKDPEAKALLEMSGRTMHSEAYREPAPILDDEEEWKQ